MPHRIFGAADIYVIPLSILFTAGSIFLWVSAAWKSSPVAAFGFAAMSLNMLVGRLLVKYMAKKATTYKLTNKRALVIRRGKLWATQEVDGVKVQLTESWSRKYATATFNDNPVEGVFGMSIWEQFGWLSENTGLYYPRAITGGSRTVRFFDLPIEDAKRLVAARTAAGRMRPDQPDS